MRLICPNCDAQYEVADDVIPPDGRDVQCSNCGHTWFQEAKTGPRAPAPEPPAQRSRGLKQNSRIHESGGAESAGTESADPAADFFAGREKAGAPDLYEDDEDIAGTPAAPEDDFEASLRAALEDDEDRDAAPTPPPAPRRKLDPSVADVLREEARREALARQREAEALESQPELALPESEPRARQHEDLPEDEDEDLTPAMAGAGSSAMDDGSDQSQRREVFPDIEEVNSSLTATRDRSRGEDADWPEEEEEVVEKQRKGFRLGFAATIAIALSAVAAYVFAPQLSAQLPAVEPALSDYSAAVDSLRFRIDDWARALVDRIGGLTDGA